MSERKKIDYRKLCHPAHPGFRLERSPFYLMAHADFDYHEDMSTVLEKHGVNRSMYRIMTVLREHDSASIGLLAERSLTKRNTTSRIIERMVAKGLVEAFSNAADSRVTEVVLTHKGRELLNSLTPIVGRQFQRAIDGIDNEDLERLVMILQKITSNLTRLPIEAAPFGRQEPLITPGRLSPGHAWAASASGPGGTSVAARVEVSVTRGRAGIRLRNEPASAALRAAMKTAKDYLSGHARELLGTVPLASQELSIDVQPLVGDCADRCSSMGMLLALCSALLKKPLRGALIVVGELDADTVKPVADPAPLVEAAAGAGARAVLLPVSCRRALADVSDETAAQIETVFYDSVASALAKALLE